MLSCWNIFQRMIKNNLTIIFCCCFFLFILFSLHLTEEYQQLKMCHTSLFQNQLQYLKCSWMLWLRARVLLHVIYSALLPLDMLLLATSTKKPYHKDLLVSARLFSLTLLNCQDFLNTLSSFLTLLYSIGEQHSKGIVICCNPLL